MLCVSVSLNGVPQVVAGALSTESTEAVVGLYPGFQEAFLRITGTTLPNDQPPADADWLSSSLKVGDVVELRLIDSSEPTAPRLGRADTTVNASDEIPFICAFCNKPAVEVDGMIAGPRAMICHGCVRALHRMLDDDSSAP